MDMGIDITRRNKKPRPLSEAEKDKLDEFVESIHYSARYSDSEYEYRHVQLPKQMLKVIPKEYFDGSRGTLKLLWEEEWRALGITQATDQLPAPDALANLAFLPPYRIEARAGVQGRDFPLYKIIISGVLARRLWIL
ncbi:Cyclin-dependent kinases regulatory subunit (Cell division control protein cks1) [Diplodia seriata]|uniref:Cyclin-dependent kinases regulatory subunit n=1 Tax=Diplodia seriata TaxID=420778 RepID=A0ABR3C1W5_9PEZI